VLGCWSLAGATARSAQRELLLLRGRPRRDEDHRRHRERRRVAPGITVAELGATVVAGAGAPQDDGSLHLAPNLSRTREIPLADQLRVALGTVTLENDVNAAAVAEGTALDAENFVFVAVGTGIGMGVIVRSEIVRGAHGATGVPSSTREIFRRASEDPSGREAALVDQMSYEAARAIAAVAAVLDPEVVVLGGGIGSRQDFRDRIHTWLGALGHHDINLILSTFRERATLVGALELARRAVPATHIEGTLS
jgi:glucokinase